MGFMTYATLGNKTVLASMAIPASYIGLVLARKIGHFLNDRGMTRSTHLFDLFTGDGQGLVRICMADKTRGERLVLSMESPASSALMAPSAVRHDLIVILLSRTKHMVFSMAPDAFDLMLTPFLFNSAKN
jgi:hypothetical protein